MTTSFLVRVHDGREQGCLVGRVTEIESGVTAIFRTTEELVAFLGAGTTQLTKEGRGNDTAQGGTVDDQLERHNTLGTDDLTNM